MVDGLTTTLISRENIAFIYSGLPGVAKRLELLQSFFNFEFVAFFIPCERVVNIDSLVTDSVQQVQSRHVLVYLSLLRDCHFIIVPFSFERLPLLGGVPLMEL